MSLDLKFDYKKAKDKIAATKAYKDLKSEYDRIQKEAGDSFEKAAESVTSPTDQVEKFKKSFQKQLKTQLEQLLDINNVTGGRGSNTIGYIKKLFIKTIKNIEPKIQEILNEEALNAIGCDQQQTYDPTLIWIKVSSIDLGGLLKLDPNEGAGKVLYEKRPITIQTAPFSMNRELYQRIQSTQSYFQDNLQNYKGESGQDLFNIQFSEPGPFGQSGGWFKVTLVNRFNNINRVGEFLVD
jgi:hypothetical protein